MKVVNSDGTAPLEAGALEGIKMIEADMERTGGWDQPHLLGTFYRHEVDINELDLREMPPGAANSALGFMFEYHVVTVLTPEMSAVRPATLINALVDNLESFGDQRPKPGEGFQGWFFAYEAFGVAAEDEKDKAAVDRQAHKRKLNEHPRRFEMRGITAVDITDMLYTVIRIKGEPDDKRTCSAEPLDHYRGDVPNALQRLVRASI